MALIKKQITEVCRAMQFATVDHDTFLKHEFMGAIGQMKSLFGNKKLACAQTTMASIHKPFVYQTNFLDITIPPDIPVAAIILYHPDDTIVAAALQESGVLELPLEHKDGVDTMNILVSVPVTKEPVDVNLVL